MILCWLKLQWWISPSDGEGPPCPQIVPFERLAYGASGRLRCDDYGPYPLFVWIQRITDADSSVLRSDLLGGAVLIQGG